MGAWGFKSFENDIALDWLDSFKENCNIRYLKETFETVLKNDDYIEVDEGAAVIAAADIIVMLHGNRPFTEDINFRGIKFSYLLSKLNDSLIQMAVEAIKKVKIQEISEVAALWEDSEQFKDWLQEVNDIEAKLILPKQVFLKPKFRKIKQQHYYFKKYPTIISPLKDYSISIDENGIDEENATTDIILYFIKMPVLVFSVKGTNLNILVEWINDFNVRITSDKYDEVLIKRTEFKFIDIINFEYLIR